MSWNFEIRRVYVGPKDGYNTQCVTWIPRHSRYECDCDTWKFGTRDEKGNCEHIHFFIEQCDHAKIIALQKEIEELKSKPNDNFT